jgi:hypothetical protein
MKICWVRYAAKGISKISMDMVNSRTDFKRVENLLTDSRDDINSVSPGENKLPGYHPSEEQHHRQNIRSERKGKDFFRSYHFSNTP